MRTLLGHLELRFNDEDIYAMRRTLSSKLLALKVDTGVRQRILGHLEGTTVDRHYSDDGLQDLKALLDAVDYGLKVGRARQFGFPVILGCSTPILPSIDVLVSLTDDGKVCALRLCDPDTDEAIIGARIEGTACPKDEAARNLPILPMHEIATQVLALQTEYSFTLPACEESTAGFEHLLIHGELPAPKPVEEDRSAPSGKNVQENEREATAPGISPWALTGSGSATPVDGAFQTGDTAICVFPLTRRGNQDGQPRPGLIVAVRTLAGRRYLDVAQGTPAASGQPASHHFVLNKSSELTQARLRQPTCFDLRRRMLIAEDDAGRVYHRLGALSDSARRGLGETMAFAGDVSPEPVCERPASRGNPVLVERRSGKAMKGRPARIR